MSSMTGLGRYQMGLALEKEGYAPAEIALRCGYKDAQAWHSSKHYYRKREQAMQELAKPKTSNDNKPAPILEGLNLDRRAVDRRQQADSKVPPAPAAWPETATPTPAPAKGLQLHTRIQAAGQNTDYRIESGKLWMRKRGRAKTAYAPYSAQELACLIAELGQLLQHMEGQPHE